jgi:3'5'-cyclic nucleotide phosphodiesterase
LETSGEGNRIHVSTYTADLIKEAGHPNWTQRREGSVHLKGKGSVETYWLFPSSKYRPKGQEEESAPDTGCAHGNIPKRTDSADPIKKERLIAWNSEALLRVIKQIIARRHDTCAAHEAVVWETTKDIPFSEVVEVIELPDKVANSLHLDPQSIVIDPKIAGLVYKYVTLLADMYRDNPFHNFEHASHVTMSVIKLLSRIVAPFNMDFDDNVQASDKLHDHTYGITSDPLTQFACVFSALIHDVDHPGVSNATLAAEDNKLMKVYRGKSLAEQNSVDKAWDLLMTEPFRPLVAILCRDQSDLSRLRQLVVNSVMATDIMDPDLKKLRNARWDTAFNNTKPENEENSRAAINRKATIVIEHITQASDVSHTMQHWNVYTKWNGRLFKEMYKAYTEGRAGAKDPSKFWAKGEIGFFDFYIIPLAKKLKECGVFGVSSDEYLQYAISNRNEWEEKGEAMLEQLMAEVREEMGLAVRESHQ